MFRMAYNLYRRHRHLSTGIFLRIISLVIPAFLFISFSAHPYYMSVTEIDYLVNKKEIEISCKLFSDDFEEALSLVNGRKIKLIESFQSASTDSVVFRYLKQHLQLAGDGRSLQLKWEGKELQGEAVWCYLSVSNVSDLANLTIENDLLLHYREDQVNIVHMKAGSKKNSCRLVAPEKKCQLRLK
jgi:hypothetical protein